MYKAIIYLLLLTQGISNARKGGFFRGSSGARTNARSGSHSAGGFHSQTNYRPQQGGYHPQQGAYHPQQGGYHPQPGGYRQPGTYHPGGGYNKQQPGNPNQDKLKSPNTGTFKKALLGGALGAAAEPLKAPNGQNYYFDERNHQSKNGYFMCSMPIHDVVKTLQENSTSTPTTDESRNSTAMTPEQFFKTVQFQDGSRPKSLTWNCMSGTEVCCGTECCPAPKRDGGNSIHHKRPLLIIFVRCVDILKFEQS